MGKPGHILLGVAAIIALCALGLNITAMILRDRELGRIGVIAIVVSVSIGSLPLIGTLIYFGVLRLRRRLHGHKRPP